MQSDENRPFIPPNNFLERGWAHNDYWQKEPLLDALEHGYTYIEADVHLIDNELYVSHKRPIFPSATKTLKTLYLQPLFDITQSSNHPIFQNPSHPIFLVIDIKTDPEKTYILLREQLEDYESMLTTYQDHLPIPGSVSILITGNRPIQTILAEEKRMVCIDGRPSDLGKDYPVSFMPIVSEKSSRIQGFTAPLGLNYGRNQNNIKAFADQVSGEGRKCRLWKIPESEKSWEILTALGIDLLNADNLPRMRTYLEKHPMLAKH